MTTHFSILAWKILWTKEPGRLQFMVLQRVRHESAHTESLQGCLTLAHRLVGLRFIFCEGG